MVDGRSGMQPNALLSPFGKAIAVLVERIAWGAPVPLPPM